MYTVVIGLIIFIAVLLILVVLVQNLKEAVYPVSLVALAPAS
jgi:preprotein translocase subunit SecG